MAKEIEINLEEENNVSMEVKDTGNVEIGMESDFGGTTDYNKLKNKPSINGVTLEGNKTLEELGIINYDDTEIKENITEIEKENTYQNKRLEYLEKNQIQGEVKGEDTLTITDGALAYANILKETEIEVEGEKKKAYIVGLPQGVSRQEQREGYNKLNLENEGKELSLEYTAEYNLKYENCKEQQTLKAGTYTLALKVKSLANGSINAISLKNVDTTVATFSEYTTTTTTEKIFIKTITVDTDITFNRISIQNAQIGTYIIKEIMILEGTYTEENLPAYEQYGATPSIEIPSEIENVRAWNLFNAYITKQNIGGVDVEFDENTGILTLNGTCTETKQISFDKTKNNIETKANIKYTLEIFKVDGTYTFGGTSAYGESSIQLWDSSSGTWKYPYQLFFKNFGNKNKLSASHTYDIDILYNQAQFKLEAGDIFNNFKIKVQFSEGDSKEYLPYGAIGIGLENKNKNTSSLEEGDTATSYVEHQEQNYNLHIKDLELNGIGDTRDSFVVELDNSYSYKKVKKLYLKKKFDEYIFNGTEPATGILNKENFIKIFYNQLSKKIYKPQNNAISSVGLLLSNYFKVLTNPNTQWLNDSREDITVNTLGNITFSVSNNIAKTEEEFKAKLLEFYNNSRPVKIIYRLNEPELIDLTEDYPQLVEDIENIINNMFTYEEVTHIDTPIGYMELIYTKSNKLIIKNYDDRISALEQAILSIGGQNV